MASTPGSPSAKLVESGESPRRIPPGRRREILRGEEVYRASRTEILHRGGTRSSRRDAVSPSASGSGVRVRPHGLRRTGGSAQQMRRSASAALAARSPMGGEETLRNGLDPECHLREAGRERRKPQTDPVWATEIGDNVVGLEVYSVSKGASRIKINMSLAQGQFV